MARCNNETLLKKINLNTLDQSTEIDFRIRKDLPDCRKINTNKFTDISGAYSYNKYRKPTNRFECMRKGCVNTGVLMMDAAEETATYHAMFDATEFAGGVVTFYVYPDEGAEFPITTKLTISETDEFTDANVYEVEITEDMVTDDGFVPVMINLANPPQSEEGEGWTPSQAGAYFKLESDKKVGYSSISIFDSIEDFDLNEVVTISCLTSIGGTFDLEVVEAQCQEARYNDQINTLTYPVTGTKITPNFMNLFPMLGKGKNDVGFDMVTVEKTIGEDGKIILPDLNQDVCGLVTVQADDACDITEAMFTQSSATDIEDVDEAHFIINKKEDGTTELVFNEVQAGVKVLVRYPKTVEIEEMVANADNLNSAQVSMIVPVYQNDGTKYVYIYDNVYITSFPMTITSDTAEFAFTITIGRDDDGNFFRMQRIIG